ncbi:peptidase S41 family protein [Actinidia rufa]|uniref:Peptidase S41 family protein n=1 Tax=Actinidia rufa TaxID=165716 RepID=A0A7J0E4W6_9ERIC|nr:peptidase S41 family protein [Actinidia rufa]
MARAPWSPSPWSLSDGGVGACLVEIGGDILLSISEGSLTLEITYLMEILLSARLTGSQSQYLPGGIEEPRTRSLGDFKGLGEIVAPLKGDARGGEPSLSSVNKGTASASEILAGALKDNKRAVLFGEPTYGKGKIQSVFELSDGSGLAVTVARYETPAHTDIDKVGVIPDHPLPASFPKDDQSFCSCLQDPVSACYLNKVELFSR